MLARRRTRMAGAARPRHGAVSSLGGTLAAAAIALVSFVGPMRCARAAEDDEDPAPTVAAPLPWQDPAPFARMFLQLPFEAPETVGADELESDLRVLYSNSLLIGRNDRVALEVTVETAQPTVLLRYGLVDRVELELAIPVVSDFGGILDKPIEVVEGWLNTSNPDRLGRPRNVARFHVVRPDGSGFSHDGGETGLGDVWTAVKALLVEQAGGRPAVALRAAVKAPTGRPPYGSGELDAGGGILAGWSWRRLGVRVQVDVIAPTAGLRVAEIATHPYGAAQVGVAVAVSDSVAFHAQWSSHRSPLTGTGLLQLDAPTHYVLAGLSFAAGRKLSLETAVVENVFSPHWGADFTLLFGARARL